MHTSELSAISLDELDARAALLRRVDVKYVLPRDRLDGLLDRLGNDHDVLEIDGKREFAYHSVYFDTEGLRCFHDHLSGVKPRFKARTRTYVETGVCVFEVKLKPVGGGTDKRQVEHPADRAAELTPEAAELVAAALGDVEIDVPGDLAPVLHTRFRRTTLAAREGDARLTLDAGIELAGNDGAAVRLDGDLVLVESKSEDGDSAADHAVVELGGRQMSISKYRTGIDALLERDDTGELDDVRELFVSA